MTRKWRTQATALAVLVLALCPLAACDKLAPHDEQTQAPAADLEAPAPETDPDRHYNPANDAATAATGALTVSVAMQMPDAAQADQGASPRETLHARGANGLILEAGLQGASSPSTQVAGQTLRALLGLPVEASQTLVYRVDRETKPENGQGICGAGAPAYVVVWEPDGPGASDDFKMLGVQGAAPGAAGAQPCGVLAYRRQ